jgi:YD repeat-containing protein
MLAIEDPDGGISTMTYDPQGTLASRTNARGQTTLYGYDPLDRVVSIDRPAGEGDAAIAYDPRARERASVSEDGPRAYSQLLLYD